ncbi:glycosyl hydrolase family 61-domain-containing protein [Halenospora varia]|nr:glycosyl hydrolase family 61-domain-containing protein [Halenospora varia]
MRSSLLFVVGGLATQQVAGHALFQQLWVNGSSCARVPTSNTPVTDVGSTAFRCNGRPGVAGKCAVVAGQTVTVEMHQQPGDRACGNEAIGGAHYGPVMVYMSKVPDATKADGSTGWFKVFQDSWAHVPSAKVGDDDLWGTKDLNKCCGRMNVVIPSDIPAGDYLLRAEVNALHTASGNGGAQFYMTCYQLSVTGGGSASPALVNFPGAYKASDPGIKINIHAAISTYIAPGPTVYSGGTTKSAGAACVGVEAAKTTGPAVPTKAARFAGGA